MTLHWTKKARFVSKMNRKYFNVFLEAARSRKEFSGKVTGSCKAKG